MLRTTALIFFFYNYYSFFLWCWQGEKNGRKLQQSFEGSRLSFWGLGWGDPTTTKLFEVKNTLSFQNGRNWTLRARFPTGSLCPVCFCLWKIYYFFLRKYKESLLEGRFSPFSIRHWWKGRGRVQLKQPSERPAAKNDPIIANRVSLGTRV